NPRAIQRQTNAVGGDTPNAQGRQNNVRANSKRLAPRFPDLQRIALVSTQARSRPDFKGFSPSPPDAGRRRGPGRGGRYIKSLPLPAPSPPLSSRGERENLGRYQ